MVVMKRMEDMERTSNKDYERIGMCGKLLMI
jgi:hypothetical protein